VDKKTLFHCICVTANITKLERKEKKKQENIGEEWLICVCYTFFTVDLSF